MPRRKLVVITGPSGSGKSSLAFDTLFAEGQRQYLESMSLFSRQLVNQLPRPDVDRITGVEPALCLDQARYRSQRRSTVGTLSEIYDYFRLLMARVGTLVCPGCQQQIRSHTSWEVCERLLKLPPETKLMILAPAAIRQKGVHQQTIQQIRKEGLVRVRINRVIHDTEHLPALSTSEECTIEAVLDRIIVRDGIEERLLEAIDNAIRVSNAGSVVASWLEKGMDRTTGWQDASFATEFRCDECDIEFSEIEPRTFNFNSPYGACLSCNGLGSSIQFDPHRTLDLAKSLSDGAVIPWQMTSSSFFKRQLKAVSPLIQQLGFSQDQPLQELPEEAIQSLFFASEKSTPGIAVQLEKEYATSDSDDRLDELETFQQMITCQNCQGTRLNEIATSVKFGSMHIGQWVELPLNRLSESLAAAVEGLSLDLLEVAQRSFLR